MELWQNNHVTWLQKKMTENIIKNPMYFSFCTHLFPLSESLLLDICCPRTVSDCALCRWLCNLFSFLLSKMLEWFRVYVRDIGTQGALYEFKEVKCWWEKSSVIVWVLSFWSAKPFRLLSRFWVMEMHWDPNVLDFFLGSIMCFCSN